MSILKWCILTGFNSLSLIDHHHLSVSLLLSYTLLFYTNQNVIMKEIFITLFYIWQVDNLLNDLISLESVDPNVDQDLNLLEPSLNHMSTTVSHNKEQPPPPLTPPPKKKGWLSFPSKKKKPTLFSIFLQFLFFFHKENSSSVFVFLSQSNRLTYSFTIFTSPSLHFTRWIKS